MKRHGLSKQQQIVLQCLLGGQSVTEAAEAAKVDRSTVYRWLRDDYDFQAAINRGRREVQLAIPNSITSIVEPAIQVVRAAIQRGDVRAALAVLKGAGLGSSLAITANDEDPEHLRKLAELEAMKRTAIEQGMDWNDYVKAMLR